MFELKVVSLRTNLEKSGMYYIGLSIGFVMLALVLLSVRVLCKRNGRFSSQHISQSPTMRQRGIHCATSQDREERMANPNKIDPKQL